MNLTEILKSQFELRNKPLDTFDIFSAEKYLGLDSDHYKHTLGVASQMQALVKQIELTEKEKEELMQIAFMHDVAYSKLVKRRGFHALDGAIFAKEGGFSDEVALAVMFHTAAEGEAQYKSGAIQEIYLKAAQLVEMSERVQRYIELITFCDLTTEFDGTPTSINRRIFKILTRYEKDTPTYMNIKENKKRFKKLNKKVLGYTIKEESWWEKMMREFKG